jgi:hypothetical protein
MKMFVHGKYFYGNEVSEYGQEHGYVDYRTLAKAFDAVMNNDIIQKTMDIGYWEQESGFVDNTKEIEELQEQIDSIMYDMEEIEEVDEDYESNNIYLAMKSKVEKLQEEIEELEEQQDNYPEIYQYFIVDGNGAEILQEAGEIVFYNEALDMYVWGVTHWGTSWDYVLTDIKCNVPYEDE